MPEEDPLVDGVPLSSLKVSELREQLKKRKLSFYGNKIVLADRLRACISTEVDDDSDSSLSHSDSAKSTTPSRSKSDNDDDDDDVEDDQISLQDTRSKSSSPCDSPAAPSARLTGLIPCIFTTDGWGRPRLIGRFDGSILEGQYVRLVDFTLKPPHCVSWEDPWTYFLCFAHPEPFPQPVPSDPVIEPALITDDCPDSETMDSPIEVMQVHDPYSDSEYSGAEASRRITEDQGTLMNHFDNINNEFCSSFLNF